MAEYAAVSLLPLGKGRFKEEAEKAALGQQVQCVEHISRGVLVGRVGDDRCASGRHLQTLEEVYTAFAVAAIGNIGGSNVIPFLFKPLRETPIAARRLPDVGREGQSLVRQKEVYGYRVGGIEVVGGALLVGVV